MKPNDQIRAYRGEVIELFSELETIIASIISQHYFGKFHTDFVLNVLYDDQCSFGLKRNILKKIVPDLDDKIRQKLDRLNRTRNIFAHCTLELVKGSSPQSDASFFPNPGKPKESIDFKVLRDSFVTDFPAVNKYLLDILEKKGQHLKGRISVK
jgi:hypothetical protein